MQASPSRLDARLMTWWTPRRHTGSYLTRANYEPSIHVNWTTWTCATTAAAANTVPRSTRANCKRAAFNADDCPKYTASDWPCQCRPSIRSSVESSVSFLRFWLLRLSYELNFGGIVEELRNSLCQKCCRWKYDDSPWSPKIACRTYEYTGSSKCGTCK